MSENFFLEKATDPFADTLAAHGLARLLRDVLSRAYQGSLPAVRIIDCGSYYWFQCARPITGDVIDTACRSSFNLTPILVTSKNADAYTGVPDAMKIHYEEQRHITSEYFDWLKALSAEQRRDVMRGDFPTDQRQREPHRHWQRFTALNSPTSLIGYNALAEYWWRVHDAMPQVLGIILDLTSSLPNDVAAAEAAWKELDEQYGWGIKPRRSALQLFNPGQGKGQNRSKADRLSMGNVDGFWLLEWLKAAGFYDGALTRLLKSNDRKTYVLAPVQVDTRFLFSVMKEFDREMLGQETSIRSDILAALRFTRVLLGHIERKEGSGQNTLMARFKRPREVVSGFYTALYKDLGNASATMNLSHIALPGWVVVHTEQEVEEYKQLLEEHEQIIRQFDESHGDDFALLQSYRDFLSGDDLTAFFAFTRGYASYIIGQRERGKRARQLTITGVERLLMNTKSDFSAIVQNEGFRRVAYAIRQSTVTAQWRKQSGDRRYEVRYGLNQELARTAHHPAKFIATLSDFMSKYNAENARVMETREGPYRSSLTTEDVEEIVRLVDEFGSEVVCNLLIAYGYARVPREEEAVTG